MSIDYDGRMFRPVSNSADGDVRGETTFRYHEAEGVVWATYQGGGIRFGTLVAVADESGNLDMRYQHVAADGAFRSGICNSRPEFLPDGRLRLNEEWLWTDGREGSGRSTIEEISASHDVATS